MTAPDDWMPPPITLAVTVGSTVMVAADPSAAAPIPALAATV